MAVGAVTGVRGSRSTRDAAELSLEHGKLEEHPTGMGTWENLPGTEVSRLGLNK